MFASLAALCWTFGHCFGHARRESVFRQFCNIKLRAVPRSFFLEGAEFRRQYRVNRHPRLEPGLTNLFPVSLGSDDRGRNSRWRHRQ